MAPSAFSSPTSPQSPMLPHKRACSLCARRKVKCDRIKPCSNCVISKAQCVYDAPVPPRPRKRAANDELITRLAQYEELMRKHDIDFTNYANPWVPSGLETKVEASNPLTPTTAPSTAPSIAPLEQFFWPDLKSELKFPPTQQLRHQDDPVLQTTPSLQNVLTGPQVELHSLHPEPRHIFRLWQRYVESVDPLIKFVHLPTLQKRVLDATWDCSRIPAPLAANMFAIYTLAVTAMSANECETTLGEPRTTLITRYRSATLRALVAADVFLTRDMEVLQALVLFLFADPESSLTLSLVSVAVKIAQVMELHCTVMDPKLTFFEREMRIRLWWQLRGLESRATCAATTMKARPHPDFGDQRPPLNVNDSDLHPDMTEPPVEHTGPTEMLLTLMKFEVTNWTQNSALGVSLFQSIRNGPIRGKTLFEAEDKAIDELEHLYQSKHLCHTDTRIPMHRLARSMGRRAVASMRFKVHHPRGRAKINGGEVYATREELDNMFEWAVIALEGKEACSQTRFAPYLYNHMTAKFEVDTYVYMISELRRRCSGSLVDRAWKLVAQLYANHPELVNCGGGSSSNNGGSSDTSNTNNSDESLSRNCAHMIFSNSPSCYTGGNSSEKTLSPFLFALGDLTLDAWQARGEQLLLERGGLRDYDATPSFIHLLLDKRAQANKEAANAAATSCLIPSDMAHLDILDGLGTGDDHDMDWHYWNKFLQI